jgi:hypothetical protein
VLSSTSTVVTMTLSATGSKKAPNVVAISNCSAAKGLDVRKQQKNALRLGSDGQATND